MSTLKLSQPMSHERIAPPWQTQIQWTTFVHNAARRGRTRRIFEKNLRLLGLPKPNGLWLWFGWYPEA